MASDSPPRKQQGPDGGHHLTLSPRPALQLQKSNRKKQFLTSESERKGRRSHYPEHLSVGGSNSVVSTETALMTNTRQGGFRKSGGFISQGRSTAAGTPSPCSQEVSLSFGEKAPLFSEVPLGRLGCGRTTRNSRALKNTATTTSPTRVHT